MKKFLLLLLLCAASAGAHDHPAKGQPAKPQLAAGAAFDREGRLWRAEIRQGRVYVSRSMDGGQSFGEAVAVNPQPEDIAGDGENSPKIAVRDGVVYVAYTQVLERPMTGNIRFSRSLDGGRTFSPPVTVNDDRQVISHRFEAMAVNGRGQVFLAWLDKRDLAAAKARGQKYGAAAVYYARSDDGGATFLPNAKLADHSCECCRVALALDKDGVPVALWRHVFGKNQRDHALARLDGKSEPRRASRDGWEVDACPHHGPALAVDAGGAYHWTWFTGAPDRAGLHYARSSDGGLSVSPPLAFGDNLAQAAHPDVLAAGGKVYLAWKEFDGRQSRVLAMASADGGATWSAPRSVAETAAQSDHPRLLANGSRAYLAWNTATEGFRLVEVAP